MFDRETLKSYGQPLRREWLSSWMRRMGCANAAEAGLRLGLSRQTVERMLHDGSAERTAVTDQTMMLASAVEDLEIQSAAAIVRLREEKDVPHVR